MCFNKLFWVDLVLCPSSSSRLDAPGHLRELVPWSQIECKMGLSSLMKRDGPKITLVLSLSLKGCAKPSIPWFGHLYLEFGKISLTVAEM